MSFSSATTITRGTVPVGMPHGPQLVQQVTTAMCNSSRVAVVCLNLAIDVTAHLRVVALFVVSLSRNKPNT